MVNAICYIFSSDTKKPIHRENFTHIEKGNYQNRTQWNFHFWRNEKLPVLTVQTVKSLQEIDVGQ